MEPNVVNLKDPPAAAYEGTKVLEEELSNVLEELATLTTQLPRATIEYARKCANPAELIQHMDAITPVKRSRSYYHLLELASVIPEIYRASHERTLHLCEAPGGFVDAVLMLSNNKADWHAVTIDVPGLPKFYPHLAEAKKVNGHARVIYGEHGSGDVLDPRNTACIVHEVGAGKASLVTADADITDGRILAAEMRIAALTLRKGGSFVLRIEHETPETRRAAWTACALFETVKVYRLATTNPCDPERYLTGVGFLGRTPDNLDIIASLEHNEWIAPEPEGARSNMAAMTNWIDYVQIGAIRKCISLARHMHIIGLKDAQHTRDHYATKLINNVKMREDAASIIHRIVPGCMSQYPEHQE